MRKDIFLSALLWYVFTYSFQKLHIQTYLLIIIGGGVPDVK